MSTDLKTLRIFMSIWRAQPWMLLGSMLMGPAFVLQNVIAPLFVAKALGQLATSHTVHPNIVLFVAASLVSGWILYYISDEFFCSPRLTKSLAILYNRCFTHLMQQDYEFFANHFSGSLVTQSTHFVKAFELFDATFFIEMIGPFCGVLVALGIMIAYSPLIGIIIATLWLAAVILVGYLAIKRMPVRRQAVAKQTQQTGELADVMTNAVAVKTFAGESFEAKRYNDTNQKRSRLIFRSWSLAIRNNLVIQIICGLLQLAVLIGGIHEVAIRAMSLATFLLFQVYILRIIDSVSKASQVVRQLEGLFGDAHEMTKMFEQVGKIRDPEKPKKLHLDGGSVAFNTIDFTYDKNHPRTSEALFKQLELVIKPGERVGLVGSSGGGKTTITRLLLRFYDVQAGSITIDNQDIRDITQHDLHEHIAYVPQEPVLFHRSLLENIAYGNAQASREAVEEAAKRAHADEFIKSLPEGYNTLVGERGVKLSGGQRQRVAIARAILKDAPILILDEATSALDSESEVLIQDALWQLMEHRTAIVIAHRLSTVQKMDRIVVLEKGMLTEQGSHQQLLKQKGIYAKLWAHQSGGFIEE